LFYSYCIAVTHYIYMHIVRGRVALMLPVNDDDKKVVWLTALMCRRRSTTACNRHHVNSVDAVYWTKR